MFFKEKQLDVTLLTEYKNKLRSLSEETIDVIATEIFDMESIEDLKKYF